MTGAAACLPATHRARASPLALLGALLVLFIVGPLLRLLLMASPSSLAAALADPELQRRSRSPSFCATVATLIAALLGVPLGYLLARYRFPGRGLLSGIVDLPVVIPHPVAGIALLLFLGPRSRRGRGTRSIGLEFVSHVPGIVAGMLFVSAPLLVSGAREAFATRRPQARAGGTVAGRHTLAGASAASPCRSPAAASWPARILAWARSVSEFGSIVILTYNPKVASILIFDRFTAYGLPAAVPAAVLLLLVALAGVHARAPDRARGAR